MNYQHLEKSVRSGFSDWTKVIPLDTGECLIRLPFWDNDGDPLELTVATERGRATIDDAGSIAGLLFSSGEDSQSSPSFKLLADLKHAHDFEIDFGNGLVKISVPEDNLYDGIVEMAKVVIAMHTATPHIRSRQRRASSFGPRVKTKMQRQYRELKILSAMQRSYALAGATVTDWPIDFGWSVGANGSLFAVNVVAADLRVSEPFAKADKIVALSVDTREQHQPGGDQLRVVIETEHDNASSLEAANFLRHHSSELGCRIFDLRRLDERSDFYSLSVKEITGKFHGPWENGHHPD